MQKSYLLCLIAGAACLVGCDKQMQANTEKIGTLSQKMVQLQLNQARQLAQMQSQLAALPAALDKQNDQRFVKIHDEAFFYHTNTLHLVLLVGENIEAQFREADLQRETDNALAFYYHTNQTDTMFLCVAQLIDAMAGQEKRIEDKVNAETRQTGTNLSNALLNQIKSTASESDKTEAARLVQMEANLARLQTDLAQIKARLGITNPPSARP